jgi:hypothetical protein
VEGVGSRAAAYYVVIVAFVEKPGIGTENGLRLYTAYQFRYFPGKPHDVGKGSVIVVQEVEFPGPQEPSRGDGLFPADGRRLRRTPGRVPAPLIPPGYRQVVDIAALLRKDGDNAPHADLVIIGVGLDAEDPFTVKDIRRLKQGGYINVRRFH